MLDDLGQVTTTLLCQRWHRDTNQLTLGRWIQAKIRVTDSLLNLADQILFPGLDTQGAGVKQCYVGHRIHGNHRAVIIHLNVIEQAGMSAASTHLCQIGL